jgi:hypothetical protein
MATRVIVDSSLLRDGGLTTLRSMLNCLTYVRQADLSVRHWA